MYEGQFLNLNIDNKLNIDNIYVGIFYLIILLSAEFAPKRTYIFGKENV